MAQVKDRGQQSISPEVYVSSSFFRRHSEITAALLIDHGGADHCSESRKQLIKRFAAASVLAEQFEAQLMRGRKIDTTTYSQLCNTLVRIAHEIGIDHRGGDSAPRLADLLHSTEDDTHDCA
jgi:hypothetical protein